MLHEEQKAEERRVLVVRVAEAADHRRDFRACRVSRSASDWSCPANCDVVAFEELPHEFVFADEVAIERTFGDIDGTRDIPHGGFGHALLDKQPDGGLFDAVPRVGESMSWHSE